MQHTVQDNIVNGDLRQDGTMAVGTWNDNYIPTRLGQDGVNIYQVAGAVK